MNNYLDVHSWSTQYRQERLAEARATHLEVRLREDSKARARRGSVKLALASLLSLGRGA